MSSVTESVCTNDQSAYSPESFWMYPVNASKDSYKPFEPSISLNDILKVSCGGFVSQPNAEMISRRKVRTPVLRSSIAACACKF